MSTAMNRLLWWHWLLIGLGASLILFLILYFAVIRPKNIDATTVQSDAQGIEDGGGTPEKVAAKKKELEKAKLDTKRINSSWAVESAVYMPTIEYDKDPLRAYEAIQNTGVYTINGKTKGVKDLPAIWGQWISGWYKSQAPSIATLTAFPIESFSTDPNDVANMRSISFPQAKPWDVEVVAKNFDAAMNHLRKFNGIQKHGMAVVDKVAISGQSPELHVRYALQLYVIPPSVPPAADPKISGTGGGGAAPGGGGVGGGMMPMGSGGGKMGGM